MAKAVALHCINDLFNDRMCFTNDRSVVRSGVDMPVGRFQGSGRMAFCQQSIHELSESGGLGLFFVCPDFHQSGGGKLELRVLRVIQLSVCFKNSVNHAQARAVF